MSSRKRHPWLAVLGLVPVLCAALGSGLCGPAFAQCEGEAPTSGAFRRELSTLLSQREAMSPAALEAALLPLVQDNPCVPAAALPLAQALLAQGRRAAAIDVLAAIASIPVQADNPPLREARQLLERLRRQVPVRLRLAEWLPSDTRLRVSHEGQPVAFEPEPSSAGRVYAGLLDPGDYDVVCDAVLIEATPQRVVVADGAPVDRVITPAPYFLPVEPARFDEPARAHVTQAIAAAVRGDWASARDGLRAVLAAREHARIRFNLAYTYLRLSDPLSAFLTLTELSGLPAWAEPLAQYHREQAMGALVQIALRVPTGSHLRVNRLPVVRGPGAWVLGAPTEPPAALPAHAVLWLAPAEVYEIAVEEGEFHVHVRLAERERELERRRHVAVQVAPGERAEVVLSPVPIVPLPTPQPELLGPLLLAAGAGALGAATLWGFYLPAEALRDEAGCDAAGVCADVGKIDRARDKADVATLGAAVAGVLGVGALVWGLLELTGDPPGETTQAATWFVPTPHGLAIGARL